MLQLKYNFAELQQHWSSSRCNHLSTPQLARQEQPRKLDETGKVPIIALTAHGKWFYEQAIEAGCNDLINKPVNTENLEPLLSRYLNQ